jgi:hypothetical protein
MFEKSLCQRCGRELTGVIVSTFARDGAFVVIVEQETSDCNWVRCKGCGQVLCKQCQQAQPKYCCDEDRILTRERARASLNGHGSFTTFLTRSSEAIKRLGELANKPKDQTPKD